MAGSPPRLIGPNVELRPPIAADIEARLALGNDPEIHRMFGGSRAQLTPMTIDSAAENRQGLAQDAMDKLFEGCRNLRTGKENVIHTT